MATSKSSGIYKMRIKWRIATTITLNGSFWLNVGAGGGGGGDVYSPRIDFSDARNSQYITLIFEEF